MKFSLELKMFCCLILFTELSVSLHQAKIGLPCILRIMITSAFDSKEAIKITASYFRIAVLGTVTKRCNNKLEYFHIIAVNN